MVQLIEIDEHTEVSTFDVSAFSPADIVTARAETMEYYRRDVDNPEDILVGIDVTRLEETKQVVVQVYDRDGRCASYIGPADHFVMDPPLDEEPAYDNYLGV